MALGKFLISTAEQVLLAYCASFFGLLLTTWSGEINMSVITAAAVSAVPAALAVLKAMVAKFYGNPNSANFTS